MTKNFTKKQQEILFSDFEDDFHVKDKCKLCLARDEYITLLENELNDLAAYLHIHRMKFKRLEAFKKAREKIKRMDKNKK